MSKLTDVLAKLDVPRPNTATVTDDILHVYLASGFHRESDYLELKEFLRSEGLRLCVDETKAPSVAEFQPDRHLAYKTYSDQ